MAYECWDKVIIYESASLKIRQHIPRSAVEQITFDETGRYLVLVTCGQAMVYDLDAPLPDPTRFDPLVLFEAWTGWRLWAGGACPMSAEEHRQRRTALNSAVP